MAEKKYQCIACGHEQEKYFVRMGYDYYKCSSCGLVSTYPFPGPAEIEAHYKRKFKEGNYQLIQKFMDSYLSVYYGFADLLNKRLQRQDRQIMNKKVLDIGCFTGDFLKILKDRGADVYGLELQAEAVEIANRSLDGRVYKADLLKKEFPQIEYDIVTMLGLIEHVVDPLELIDRAVALLSKGGIIMIQTPDSSSWPARVLKAHWPPYAPVEHIHLFSKESLTRLLRQRGFTTIEFHRHVKYLPVEYVFQNMKNFGPEFHRLLNGIYGFVPDFIKNLKLPFYIGEVVVLASREGQ
jgi:2-polyprenyl-3-methyl-5-hydroxy-6-metoxy-1,4-benzoquinol methylase